MAPDLPDDVWSLVVETSSLDREHLPSLSLASRRMHRLVVPVLFRYLEFRPLRGEFNYLVATLIRANMRVRSLWSSPELLQHTRVFKIWGDPYALYGIARYLVDSDDLSSSDDAANLVAFYHDAIFRLIFRMVGLRELHIYDIGMTPLCYAAISSRPLLTRLRLQQRYPQYMDIAPALHNAFRLHDFDYEYIFPSWTSKDQPPRFLIDILDHCILDLERLTIPSILLPLVVARIPSHHSLSLRSLTVRDPLLLDEGLVVAAFFKVLRASPQLQHLAIRHEGFPDVEPSHYLLPLSLPNLSTIKGTPRLLQLVTGGTNIVKISMIGTLNIEEQPLTQVILSSPTHLRDLTMRGVTISETEHELLAFIQSLAIFRNLESLTVDYDTPWEDQLSWADRVSVQDSHSTIKDLLNQLVCLRFLNIHSDYVRGYNIGCPIAKPGEPVDRGHPSLESIRVDFICGMWSWDSRTGWEERDRDVQQHILGDHAGSVRGDR